MLDYTHLKAKEIPTQDANMADPDVEFSDFTDNDVESGATASVPRVKKNYKLTQAQRDARTAKKAKAVGKGTAGSK